MASIDRAYVAIALAFLVVGEALGVYMGATNDMRLRAVHIIIVLPGFVVLAMSGFMFRLWPAMKAGALAATQFWLAVLGTLGTALGAYLLAATGSVAVIAIASVVVLISAVLLLWLFWSRSAEA
jgi:hypothetical protein